MSQLPISWSAQLQASYPARSGPCGWMSMKLMLALRSALQQSTWKEITDGCQRYKVYLQKSGKEGTEFVQSPLRFIQDGCYLEQFEHKEPQSPKEALRAEIAAARDARLDKARQGARAASVPYGPLDSAEAIETRIRSANLDPEIRPATDGIGAGQGPGAGLAVGLAGRVSSLAGRLRVAK